MEQSDTAVADETDVPPPKKESRKGKVGRNALFVPTDKDRHFVMMAATIGIPQAQIAHAFINPHTRKPINLETLREHFRDELDHGPSITTARVGASLYYNATIENNVSAQIFWMKTQGRRFGWPSEKEATEAPDTETVEFDAIDIARRFSWLIHQAKKAKGLK